ncbi:hypothetical protein FRC98_01755 [Lujinxingia vulgaris]|uniref:Uncharacterized protein n=1 Tax=Lujinxingia vulgaris TaxID=2600176 RepID=A0A5C6XNG5_9DELT|nr:hypothetical protein [Lujinxingia vulgaris]TXD39152.1 hypothetical protein FRC98_01755 [Lujinxingia vulgaris]
MHEEPEGLGPQERRRLIGWMIIALTWLLLAGVSHAQAQSPPDDAQASADDATAPEPGELRCFTCTENCEAQGVAEGERVCTGAEGLIEPIPSSTPEGSAMARPATSAPSSAPVNVSVIPWRWRPRVDALVTTLPVAPDRLQRQLSGDLKAMSACLNPRSYRPEPAMLVELRVSADGHPLAVHGTPKEMATTDARCMLKRLWNVSFELPAEPDLSQPEAPVYTLSYRLDFELVATETKREPASPVLIEGFRWQGSPAGAETSLPAPLARQAGALGVCAEQLRSQLPLDLIVAEVEMRWPTTPTDGPARPSAIDLTLSNETGPEHPSGEALQCMQEALLGWELPADEVGGQGRANFYVTIRPEGWIGAR